MAEAKQRASSCDEAFVFKAYCSTKKHLIICELEGDVIFLYSEAA